MGLTRRILLPLAFVLFSSVGNAYQTVFNPFTGSPDFVGVSSGSLPSGSTQYAQINPTAQQPGSISISSATLGTSAGTLHINATDDGLGTSGLFVTDNTGGYGTWQTPSSLEGILNDTNGNYTGFGDMFIDYYSNGRLFLSAGGGPTYVGKTTGASTFSTPDQAGAGSISGLDLTVRGSSISGAAVDKSGGNLTLASGQSTGVGTSSITFQTSPRSTTGTTANTPVTRMTINGSGSVLISSNTILPGTTFYQNGPTLITSGPGTSLNLNAGNATATNGAGGGSLFRGGNGLGAGNGGSFIDAAGNGGATGTGGLAQLGAGGGGATSGNGGISSIFGGSAGGNGDGGEIDLFAGDGVGGTHIGGSIFLFPGSTTGSGGSGTVQFWKNDLSANHMWFDLSRVDVAAGDTQLVVPEVSSGTLVVYDALTPTLSLCGTSPSIVGNNESGTVTEGSVATGCKISFNGTKLNTQHCVVVDEAGLVFSYTQTTTAITITNIGALSSTKIDYWCPGN